MLSTLAAVQRKLGDLRNSEASARKAIELCPEDWWSHVELAKTLEIAGRPHEAREALQYAMQSSEFEEKYKPHLEAEIERLKGATPHT